MQWPKILDTPWKINIEPENDSLEDDFPLQMGALSGSMLIFRGVYPFKCQEKAASIAPPVGRMEKMLGNTTFTNDVSLKKISIQFDGFVYLPTNLPYIKINQFSWGSKDQQNKCSFMLFPKIS